MSRPMAYLPNGDTRGGPLRLSVGMTHTGLHMRTNVKQVVDATESPIWQQVQNARSVDQG